MFRTCIGKLGRQNCTRRSQLPCVVYFRERLDESSALSYQKDFGSEAITEVNLRWGLVFINASFAWYLKLHLCIYKVPMFVLYLIFFFFFILLSNSPAVKLQKVHQRKEGKKNHHHQHISYVHKCVWSTYVIWDWSGNCFPSCFGGNGNHLQSLF